MTEALGFQSFSHSPRRVRLKVGAPPAETSSGRGLSYGLGTLDEWSVAAGGDTRGPVYDFAGFTLDAALFRLRYAARRFLFSTLLCCFPMMKLSCYPIVKAEYEDRQMDNQ